MFTRDALLEAIQIAGSEEKLGAALGCTQNAIWQAKKRGKVSPLMARRLDDWSHGKFPRHLLRPDIFDEPIQERAA